jgi:hypothetical protein
MSVGVSQLVKLDCDCAGMNDQKNSRKIARVVKTRSTRPENGIEDQRVTLTRSYTVFQSTPE